MKKTNDTNYFQHLKANWKVAFHSLGDFFIHFIHGLFPFIEIKHYESSDKSIDCRNCRLQSGLCYNCKDFSLFSDRRIIPLPRKSRCRFCDKEFLDDEFEWDYIHEIFLCPECSRKNLNEEE